MDEFLEYSEQPLNPPPTPRLGIFGCKYFWNCWLKSYPNLLKHMTRYEQIWTDMTKYYPIWPHSEYQQSATIFLGSEMTPSTPSEFFRKFIQIGGPDRPLFSNHHTMYWSHLYAFSWCIWWLCCLSCLSILEMSILNFCLSSQSCFIVILKLALLFCYSTGTVRDLSMV